MRNLNVFHFQVNYDLTVESLTRGQYFWQDSDINDKNFNSGGRVGCCEVKFNLFHFNKVMTSKMVILEMNRLGYRPAELHELLTFRIKHPKERERHSIAALGTAEHVPPYIGMSKAQRHQSSRCRYVPFISLDECGELMLQLHKLSEVWHDLFWFAAIKVDEKIPL